MTRIITNEGVREVHCPECGGSGQRAGTYGDIECFDCAGEGTWAENDGEQLTVCRSDPFGDAVPARAVALRVEPSSTVSTASPLPSLSQGAAT